MVSLSDPRQSRGRRGPLSPAGIDEPQDPAIEVHISQLVFSFGSAGDQIYVGGTAVYPGKGSTIELASSAIRPILGGAGKYQGATGWCQTEHLADGSWRHIFHLTGGTAAQESEATQASPSTGIIRSELGNALPATAPGQTLSLWHYSIPAGSKLMPHKHPGWQVARIIAWATAVYRRFRRGLGVAQRRQKRTDRRRWRSHAEYWRVPRWSRSWT